MIRLSIPESGPAHPPGSVVRWRQRPRRSKPTIWTMAAPKISPPPIAAPSRIALPRTLPSHPGAVIILRRRQFRRTKMAPAPNGTGGSSLQTVAAGALTVAAPCRETPPHRGLSLESHDSSIEEKATGREPLAAPDAGWRTGHAPLARYGDVDRESHGRRGRRRERTGGGGLGEGRARNVARTTTPACGRITAQILAVP